MERDRRETPSIAPEESRGEKPIEAAALLSGRREVLIAHGAELYRLRLTSNNKLILTK